MARSLLLGGVLGLATRLVYHGPPDLMWLHKLGVPWLAAAFLVGSLRRSPRSGALHGAVGLVVAVIVYYAVPVVVDYPYARSGIGMGWIWIAIPGGAAFGALGALWRAHERWRLPATAVMAGAFLGEALTWYGREREAPALAEICAAALALGLLLPRNSQRAVAAVAASGVALVAAVAVVGVYVSFGYLVG